MAIIFDGVADVMSSVNGPCFSPDELCFLVRMSIENGRQYSTYFNMGPFENVFTDFFSKISKPIKMRLINLLMNRSTCITGYKDTEFIDLRDSSCEHVSSSTSEEILSNAPQTESSSTQTSDDKQVPPVRNDQPKTKDKRLPHPKKLYTAELAVLCRICGDKASGFHYGVHSCEGCKGFFRRTIKKKLTYKPCRAEQQCKLSLGSRNKCQHCRFQRCIKAGMSQDAVRFGRMPKLEREKLVADKEELEENSSARIMELRAITDNIKQAYNLHLVEKIPKQNRMEEDLTEKSKEIVVNNIDSEEDYEKLQIYSKYQDMLIPLVEGSVKFAKQLPGFGELSMTDQITLLKQASMLVAVLVTSCTVSDSTFTIHHCDVDVALDKKAIQECKMTRTIFGQMMRFYDKLTRLRLLQSEIALFCASLCFLENPFLENAIEIDRRQQDLLQALRIELKHNHPKDRHIFPNFVMMVTDLRQTVEAFGQNLRIGLIDKSDDLTNTAPLIKEMFNI